MKMLFVASLLLISYNSFAGYKCSATKWQPGLGGSYYSLSVIPKSFKVANGQKQGVLEGFRLASEKVSYGKVDYVINGEVSCIYSDCELSGTLTEIVHGSKGNASGFSGMTSVSIRGEDVQTFQMVDNKVLKIECKYI